MPRQPTKYRENVYRKARLRAAEYNKTLLTMSSAAEEIPGVTEEALKRYENFITRPSSDVVKLMADTYNAPELGPWYCAHECPLGGDCREIPDMPSERACIRLQNAVNGAEEAVRQLSAIMEDGQINEDERPMVPEIRDQLVELKRRIEETVTVLDRAQRSGKF